MSECTRECVYWVVWWAGGTTQVPKGGLTE